MPGEYTLKLTVGGEKLTGKVVVGLDPRLHMANGQISLLEAGELLQQNEAALKVRVTGLALIVRHASASASVPN